MCPAWWGGRGGGVGWVGLGSRERIKNNNELRNTRTKHSFLLNLQEHFIDLKICRFFQEET